MDRTTQKILDGFRRLPEMPQQSLLVKVISVDLANRMIDVQTDEGVYMYCINLQAVSGQTTGLTIIPSIGSWVIISQTEGGLWYVSGFTQADKLSIKSETEDLKQWLIDLINTIEQITVTTAVGPSGTPINMIDFETIKMRLNNLLT